MNWFVRFLDYIFINLPMSFQLGRPCKLMYNDEYEKLLDEQICYFCKRSRRVVGRMFQGPSWTPDGSNRIVCIDCVDLRNL